MVCSLWKHQISKNSDLLVTDGAHHPVSGCISADSSSFFVICLMESVKLTWTAVTDYSLLEVLATTNMLSFSLTEEYTILHSCTENRNAFEFLMSVSIWPSLSLNECFLLVTSFQSSNFSVVLKISSSLFFLFMGIMHWFHVQFCHTNRSLILHRFHIQSTKNMSDCVLRDSWKRQLRSCSVHYVLLGALIITGIRMQIGAIFKVTLLQWSVLLCYSVCVCVISSGQTIWN